VLTSGDHVTPVMRAAIEDAWDCRVFEHYGSTEIGLGGAVQCRAFAGLHVREADLLFEVVDPATGERLSDGAAGELVVTTLTRRGMPLIRYRTGDLVQMAADPCACGCELRSLKTVIGRRADMVPLRGERSRGGAAAGHTSPGAVLGVVDLDEAVYAAPAVLGFTATLIGAATGDQLVLKVEVEPPVPAGVAAEVQHRVEALPVLQDALEWGSLTVAVEISSDAANLAQSAKQRIVDERSGG
jgi:phenylacetate-coenzyme A ligase PaaK-like adenylate-forming protein